MQMIFPNYLNQAFKSSLVVFLPYPFTQTSGFLTRLDIIDKLININYGFILIQSKNLNNSQFKNNHHLSFVFIQSSHSLFIFTSSFYSSLFPQFYISCQLFILFLMMKKDSCLSTLALNIFQLKQIPILKIQTHRWIKFQDKQKFLPFFRSITYQCKQIMSKMFVFHLSQQKKDSTIKRKCLIITQKQVISLQDLYQILNEKMSQMEFNAQVELIKKFQKQVALFITNKMAENYVKFKTQNYLTFKIYKESDQYVIKANLNHFSFQVQYFQNKQSIYKPSRYVIKNVLVKEYLDNKLKGILQLVNNIKDNKQINQLYRDFYDKIYFQGDQYHLRLQVYENYPLLRVKSYIPIKFNDKKTQQPLNGPIFGNADPECMYGHFFGYNANSAKQLQGTNCESCMLPIEELQQFELLIMLRDNVLNPERKDMIYCPQYNRFKFCTKVMVTAQKDQSSQEENKYEKTIIDYLNYYHFKINFKKMTNKIRQFFIPKKKQQTFSLMFQLCNKQFLIMDPARGKYCQHFAFTDLRLYYLSFNPHSNLYTCPIPQCNEQFPQNDLLYLRQAEILIQYINFKLQQCPELVQTAKVVVDSHNKKVYVEYRLKQGQKPIEDKKDELTGYYKTLQDPHVPFMEYGLGIKQKQRQQKMNKYMFGGWKQQMQEQVNYKEEEEEDQDL